MISGLPKSLGLIYRSWIGYFKYYESYYIFTPVRILIAVGIFAIVIGVGAKKLYKKPMNLVIYLFLCLCLPVGANIAVILAPATKFILTQMTAPMMLVLPLLLIYLDGIELKLKLESAIGILGALLLYGNVIAVGADIDALAQGSNSTYAIMDNIMASLNEHELLGEDYEYAFYGNIAANELFKVNEMYNNASNYAKFGTLLTKPDMVRNAYMGLFDDIGINLQSVEYNDYLDFLNSGLLDSMPAYPAKGSIAEKNGKVIVKVSEDYKWE